MHDQLCTELYDGRRHDWHCLYPHVGLPRAQQAVLFALEHQNIDPPLSVLKFLWRQKGLQTPYTFFVPAVFHHTELWTHIIQDLVRDGQWQALSSYKATRPGAQQGHMHCAHLYLDSHHATRLAAVYATTTTLLLHADRLLKRHDVDHLLLRIAGFPQFAQAVQRTNNYSTVALLGRPVHLLSHDQFQSVLAKYDDDPRYRCLHWHTDALRRGFRISPQWWHVAGYPESTHELLHRWVCGGTLRHYPHLWAKTLREQPDACAFLGTQLHDALTRHQRNMATRVHLAGSWPLPDELVRDIARFL